MFCFKLQQPSLRIQSSGKTCQGMITADNTMAGNENADTISSDSTCNGSCAIGVTHTHGYFLITFCFSVGYVEQCMPYFFLKISSYRVQRNIECLAVAGEIFVQLRLASSKIVDVSILNSAFIYRESRSLLRSAHGISFQPQRHNSSPTDARIISPQGEL